MVMINVNSFEVFLQTLKNHSGVGQYIWRLWGGTRVCIHIKKYLSDLNIYRQGSR